MRFSPSRVEVLKPNSPVDRQIYPSCHGMAIAGMGCAGSSFGVQKQKWRIP